MKAMISILMLIASLGLFAISCASIGGQEVPAAWYIILALWIVLFGIRIYID